MFIVILAALLGILAPCFDFFRQSVDYVSARANADEDAAALAERVSGAVTRIDRMNAALRALRIECAATALLDLSAPARIAVEGHALAVLQDALRTEISVWAAERSLSGRIEWSPQPRGPDGPCGVPAALELGDSEVVFSFRGRLAGVVVTADNECSDPGWHFSHPEAVAL